MLVFAEQRATDGGTLLQRLDFEYDVFGNRIERAVTTGSTTVQRFSWDGRDIWADLDGSSSLTTRRVFGDGVNEPLARIAGSAEWYLQDRMGSVRDVVNAAGAVIAHVTYDAWGLVTGSSGTTDRYLAFGYQLDAESGLYYVMARYMDPVTHLWVSQDPIGFDGGDANLYRYVGNGPTNGVDPTGKYIWLFDWNPDGGQKAFHIFHNILDAEVARTNKAYNWAGGLLGIDNLGKTFTSPGRYANLRITRDGQGRIIQPSGYKITTPYNAETLGTVRAVFYSRQGKDNKLMGRLLDAYNSPNTHFFISPNPDGTLKVDELIVTGADAAKAGAVEGLGDATYMLANALTAGLVPGAQQRTNELVCANGGAYGPANAWFGLTREVLMLYATLGSGNVLANGARCATTEVAKQSTTAMVKTAALRTAQTGFTLLEVGNVYSNTQKTVEAFRKGDYAEGAIQALTTGISIFNAFRGAVGLLTTVCFRPSMPMLTPAGPKPIGQFRAGDPIFARRECDPDAPLEVKYVEEVFTGRAVIWNLHVGGRVIESTAEHPFWARGKGWTPLKELQAGDMLHGHDGQWVAVEEAFNTGVEEDVCNVRVADHHTYFVGGDEWGFSVWAHNSCFDKFLDMQVKAKRLSADQANAFRSDPEFRRIYENVENPADLLGALKAAQLKKLYGIPGTQAEFAKWFNGVDKAELNRLYAIQEAKDAIKDMLRHGGGDHEWLLVSRANRFKEWGIRYEDIVNHSTPTKKTFFLDKAGKSHPHSPSNPVASAAHDELGELIDSSKSYNEFVMKLNNWAKTNLPNGAKDLPPGLQLP